MTLKHKIRIDTCAIQMKTIEKKWKSYALGIVCIYKTDNKHIHELDAQENSHVDKLFRFVWMHSQCVYIVWVFFRFYFVMVSIAYFVTEINTKEFWFPNRNILESHFNQLLRHLVSPLSQPFSCDYWLHTCQQCFFFIILPIDLRTFIVFYQLIGMTSNMSYQFVDIFFSIWK